MFGYTFLDTETTGLNPDIHEVFEIAAIFKQRDSNGEWVGEEKRTHLMIGPHQLETAESEALKVNNYYARAKEYQLEPYKIFDILNPTQQSEQEKVIYDLEEAIENTYLVGANPSFDARFLEVFFSKKADWKYRLIDVEAMALQKFNWVVPRGLQQLAEHLKINSGEAHTAMADAETVLAVFESLTNTRSGKLL